MKVLIFVCTLTHWFIISRTLKWQVKHVMYHMHFAIISSAVSYTCKLHGSCLHRKKEDFQRAAIPKYIHTLYISTKGVRKHARANYKHELLYLGEGDDIKK